VTLDISCALATSLDSPEHARIAETLGYRRAWFYDSPALYPDVWMQLALTAERTERIGLGPGVLIPSLRHPMATASAIGTLVDAAGPGRVAVGVGSGFTGRFTLGQRPLRWADVEAWVRCVRGLLAGDTVQWEGAAMRMLHPDGFAPARPIDVPFLMGAAGPKGRAVADALGAGLFHAGSHPVPGVAWQAMLTFGTVLDDDEDVTSPRVMDAAGHGAAVAYHFAAENGLGVEALPDGEAWLAAYADVPEDERHLAIHDLHLVGVNERDRPFITPAFIAAMGGAFRPAELRDRLAALEAAGATEIVYQPAGPDIARELDAFITAAHG
jgi:5,10-methylenetetrahydromethanopterin reductase